MCVCVCVCVCVHYSVGKVSYLQWSALAWGDLELSYAYVNVFPPVNSVSWWQEAFDWDSVYCSRRIFIARKMTELQKERTWFIHFWRKTRLLISGEIAKKKSDKVRCSSSSVIFLTMKNRREHWTLLHSNAACHQLTLLTGGKKFTYAYEGPRSPYASALHWNSAGFRKQNKVGNFSNRVVYYMSPLPTPILRVTSCILSPYAVSRIVSDIPSFI